MLKNALPLERSVRRMTCRLGGLIEEVKSVACPETEDWNQDVKPTVHEEEVLVMVKVENAEA